MNGYDLSRDWFDFCFENPDKIKPLHTAIYFFAIEHCNRLGWKEKFGFPSQMVMEAVGIKNWRTFSKGLTELVEFGFIKMVEKSKNQYSSNIIAIVKNTKANTKALDKALQKHNTKHSQSTVSIDKQETINKEQITKSDHLFKNSPYFDFEYFKQQIDEKYHKFDLKYYHENAINYSESKGAKYKDWLAALRNWMNRDEKEGKAKMSKSQVKKMPW